MLTQEAIDILARHRGNAISVVTMQAGDFYGSEQSRTLPADCSVRIELRPAAGGAPPARPRR